MAIPCAYIDFFLLIHLCSTSAFENKLWEDIHISIMIVFRLTWNKKLYKENQLKMQNAF